MASHNIPNRPAGTDPRSIADILANFDYITNLTEGLAEGTAFDAGAITSGNLKFVSRYAKALSVTSTTSWHNISISSINPGVYVVVGGVGNIFDQVSSGGFGAQISSDRGHELVPADSEGLLPPGGMTGDDYSRVDIKNNILTLVKFFKPTAEAVVSLSAGPTGGASFKWSGSLILLGIENV